MIVLPIVELGLDTAYSMGRDSVLSGPNQTNCHFSIFSSRENTDEWERGVRDAMRELAEQSKRKPRKPFKKSEATK